MEPSDLKLGDIVEVTRGWYDHLLGRSVHTGERFTITSYSRKGMPVFKENGDSYAFSAEDYLRIRKCASPIDTQTYAIPAGAFSGSLHISITLGNKTPKVKNASTKKTPKKRSRR